MDSIQNKILNVREFTTFYKEKHFYVKCFKNEEWIIIKFYKTPYGWKDMYIDSSWKGQYLLRKFLGNIYVQLNSSNINFTYQSIKEWLECDFDSVVRFHYTF